ncbi:DUF1592 domain-containing protein [Opitutia bacterium ISCC 51]|nr:DUF1592 domain-containing protein [Opitutae bacterium ISCC 51]QXD26724.1 DUF1592 domain-containing protein [Opitutae bacterium ISCC 52]
MRAFRHFVFCVLLVGAFSGSSLLGYERIEFLEEHCISCHGPKKQKGDRRFDDLSVSVSGLDELERWQEILDMLNLEDMPPEEEPQPSEDDRASMIASTTEFVATELAKLDDAGGHSVLRRLNAWEYQQTIGDLLGLNVTAWNPAADFPAEVVVDGFDNNGAELVTSGMLLDKYFVAAEEAIRRATQFGKRPKTKQWAQSSPFYFQGKENSDLPKLFQVDRFRFIPEVPYTDLYGRHYRGGHIGFEPLTRGGVAHSGLYTVRVKAAAVDRFHPYGDALDDFRNGDPLVLELMAVDREGSVESTGSITEERSLARVELTSAEPEWLEWDVYLEEGFEPEVRFRNGTLATKRLVRIITQNASEHPEVKPFAGMPGGNEKSHGLLKVYRGPKLRIWEIQVEGPHIEEWPRKGHKVLYGDFKANELNSNSIVHRLRVFAETAFRRPLDGNEILPIESMVLAKLNDGLKPLEALQLGFQTILCSPRFIYLSEGEGELDEYALASRLSYFLWSSAPDEELLAQARSGRLSNPKALLRQTRRMLKDDKSDRFVSDFIGRWLDLDNIGEMPVSEDFRVYHRDNIEAAMIGETEMFFRNVLDENLRPKEFLSADYSYLNRELGLHYGIEGIEGHELRRTSLKGTSRGGLLGQGLFLVASANGVDTSPVVRGIYVLEKLLGYSPPPPPPDVPAIESDIRGARTIREELAKHREVATCAECHRKIDPLGFALENYDAVGAWRSHYEKQLEIDASGMLPDGSSFDTVSEFRALMIEREDEFTRGLAEKLLTYALGRKLDLGDRPVLDRMLTTLKEEQGGLRDLVEAVVLSESFSKN